MPNALLVILHTRYNQREQTYSKANTEANKTIRGIRDAKNHGCD